MSRRRCDVDAELEGLAVGHRDLELAVAALDVVEKVVEALDEILPARRDRLAEYLRIGQSEIRRRQRVDVLAREEINLLARVLVEPFDVGDGVVQPARGYEVRLLDVIEQEMLLPVLVPEALVAFRRLDHGRRGLAHQLEHRRLPQRRIFPPEIHLRLGEAIGIGKHFRRQLEERLGQAEFIGHHRLAGGGLPGNEVAENLGALVGGAGQRLGQRDRIIVRSFGDGFSGGHRSPPWSRYCSLP